MPVRRQTAAGSRNFSASGFFNRTETEYQKLANIAVVEYAYPDNFCSRSQAAILRYAMKILITTDLFTTETNGVVTSVRNLRSELEASGHEVRILTLSDSIHSHADGAVTYIRSIPFGVVYPDVRMPTSYRHPLIRALVDWKPDIIHSQCEFFSYQYAKYISKRTGAPIVHTYHTLYEQYVTYIFPSQKLGARAVGFLSQKRLKRVSHLVAPTSKVEKTLRGYGIEQDISVVPSGICLEQHKQPLSKEARLERRRELGIADDDLVLLNLGRLGTEKNLSELLDLFAEAASNTDHLFFLIVGDGPAKEELEQQAHALGLTGKIRFTGMVPPSQVQNYYQLGDVFVSASTSETQGLTYVEAAANGLPLLCRRDPCLDDVLLPGENGFTYTCASEFLAALDAVRRDPQWRTAAGLKSKEIAAAFDTSTFGKSIEAIYEAVLQKETLHANDR